MENKKLCRPCRICMERKRRASQEREQNDLGGIQKESATSKDVSLASAGAENQVPSQPCSDCPELQNREADPRPCTACIAWKRKAAEEKSQQQNATDIQKESANTLQQDMPKDAEQTNVDTENKLPMRCTCYKHMLQAAHATAEEREMLNKEKNLQKESAQSVEQSQQQHMSKAPSQATNVSQKPIISDESGSEELPPALEDPMCTPNNPRVLSFEEVSNAAEELKHGIQYTPCVPSHLQKITGMDVYLKKDFMQYTGSFKDRGGRYALLRLSDEQKQKGVIAASAGNHAQALCYHGGKLGIPVSVVMPTIAPLMKVQNCSGYGGNVIVKGKDMTEAKIWAMHIAKEKGLVYINGYDHPDVLAGQGTCGIEILEQVPDVDAVVVPVGGGGLIAGVSVAVKHLKPHVQVIAAESEQGASFAKAMQEGQPSAATLSPSLADGLAVATVGYNAFATASKLVDKVLTVPEAWIAVAILRLIELEKCVVEGAGATGLAAVLSGQLDELKGKKVVVLLSGGNIDTTVLGRVIDRGMAADGRLSKFSINVMDRPGGMNEICELLSELKVSVKHIAMDRAWLVNDVFKVRTKFVCETRDFNHLNVLREEVSKRYPDASFVDIPFTKEIHK